MVAHGGFLFKRLCHAVDFTVRQWAGDWTRIIRRYSSTGILRVMASSIAGAFRVLLSSVLPAPKKTIPYRGLREKQPNRQAPNLSIPFHNSHSHLAKCQMLNQESIPFIRHSLPELFFCAVL